MCQMEDINYKEKDRENILAYLRGQAGIVAVSDVITHSGAERLRVYPILFEEIQAGTIQVLEEEVLGAPKKIQLKQ